MNATTENYIGPTYKREPDSKWTEIVDITENYHYFRNGCFYMISSVPAPRKGYTWYNIDDSFYIVNMKTHSKPTNTVKIEELMNTRIGKIILNLLEEFKIENNIHTFADAYNFSQLEKNINLRDIFVLM